MTINEFVKTLDIPNNILSNTTASSDTFVEYNLQSSDIFSKVYSKLDQNSNLDLDFDNMVIDGTKTHMVYMGDEYDVILESDFDEDEYTLIIKVAEE